MSQLVNSSALRDLQTCTQASQTMLVDNTMSQVSLTTPEPFTLSTGAGASTNLPRSAARQNLLSQVTDRCCLLKSAVISPVLSVLIIICLAITMPIARIWKGRVHFRCQLTTNHKRGLV